MDILELKREMFHFLNNSASWMNNSLQNLIQLNGVPPMMLVKYYTHIYEIFSGMEWQRWQDFVKHNVMVWLLYWNRECYNELLKTKWTNKTHTHTKYKTNNNNKNTFIRGKWGECQKLGKIKRWLLPSTYVKLRIS